MQRKGEQNPLIATIGGALFRGDQPALRFDVRAGKEMERDKLTMDLVSPPMEAQVATKTGSGIQSRQGPVAFSSLGSVDRFVEEQPRPLVVTE